MTATLVPDYVPEHLRKHYRPPSPVRDAAFFRTELRHYVSVNPVTGRPDPDSEKWVELPASALLWAESEVRASGDTRWTEYLTHRFERDPGSDADPEWLARMTQDCAAWVQARRECSAGEAARVASIVRGAALATLIEDYSQRHVRPHRHAAAFDAAVVEKAQTCTEDDLTEFWWTHYGRQQAEARLAEAQTLLEEQALADAVRQAEASAARQREHDRAARESQERLATEIDQRFDALAEQMKEA